MTYKAEYEVDRSYDKDRHSEWSKRFVDFLAVKGIKPKNVLEIGCGRGELLSEFIKCGCKAYGLDTDDYFMSICKKKGICVKRTDIEKERFPFEDNTFDLVISDNVLEHVWNPNNMMSETNRVLKPSGFVIIRTPNWKHSKNRFYDVSLTHIRPYTENTLKMLFSAHDFNVIKIYPRFGHWKFLWRRFDWAWGRSFFHPFKRNWQTLGIAQKRDKPTVEK